MLFVFNAQRFEDAQSSSLEPSFIHLKMITHNNKEVGKNILVIKVVI